jgi:hypothetical protein
LSPGPHRCLFIFSRCFWSYNLVVHATVPPVSPKSPNSRSLVTRSDGQDPGRLSGVNRLFHPEPVSLQDAAWKQGKTYHSSFVVSQASYIFQFVTQVFINNSGSYSTPSEIPCFDIRTHYPPTHTHSPFSYTTMARHLSNRWNGGAPSFFGSDPWSFSSSAIVTNSTHRRNRLSVAFCGKPCKGQRPHGHCKGPSVTKA